MNFINLTASKILTSTIALVMIFSVGFVPTALVLAEAMSSGSYHIQSDSINFAGNKSSSASYISSDTAGEIATGDLTGASNNAHVGFLQATIIPPVSPSGSQSTAGGSSGSSGGGGYSGKVSPVNAINFYAWPGEGTNSKNIVLGWEYPAGSATTSFRLVRSTKFFPGDINDGDTIYEGNLLQVVDHDIIPGVRYYYALFAKNALGVYSSGVLGSARIALPGEDRETLDQGSSTEDIFENIPIIQNVDAKIAGLTLDDFDFIQDGRTLAHAGSLVAIDAHKNLTIRLDYKKVPEILKTIAISLGDPEDPSKAFTFLLRANKDKTAYEAVVAPLGRNGNFRLNAIVIDYKNQGLKKIQGNLQAIVLGAGESLPGSGGLIPLYSMVGILILAFLIILAYVIHTRKMKNAAGLLTIIILAGTIAVLFGAHKASAAFTQTINYQGKLANSSNVAVTDGSYNLRFKLYTTATGGVPIWTETECYSADFGTTCDGTGTDGRIGTVSGLFSLMLGSTTALTSVDFNQTLYLGVEVGGSGATPTWDGEMSPRKIIGAVPAAFVSANALLLNGLASTNFFRNDAGSVTSGYFVATTTTASVFPYASSTAITVSGLTYLNGGFIAQASSTLQNFTALNSTSTNATTTSFFATTASSTSLFSTTGNITNLTANTFSVSGLTSFANLLLSGSTTLQNFTGLNSTTTNATSTSLFASNAIFTTSSSTNLFATTISSGLINGQTISSAANLTGTLTVSGLTTLTGGFLSSASSTLQNFTGLNSTTTNATSTSLFASNAIFTTSSSTNLFATTISSGLINGQTISSAANLTGTLTVSGLTTLTGGFLSSASSTLQNFTGVNATTTNATSTTFFATTASSTNLFATAITSGLINGQTIGAASNLTGTLSVSGLTTLTGGFLSLASSTLQNFTGLNSTTTNATSTSLFASNAIFTTSSSTNLFATAITSGLINGQTIGAASNFTGTLTVASGLTSLSNLLLSGSTTLQNFTGLNSTTTNATTTNLYISNALTVNGLTSIGNLTATFASTTAFTASGTGYFGNILVTGSSTFQNFTGLNSTTTNATTTTFAISGLTAGSVPFIGTSGSVSQNNANFFWDNTNTRLGIGTTTPGSILSVAGVGNFASTGSTLYSTLTAPYFTATSSTASVFPYASTTAITVSGLSYLNGGFLSLASSTFQNFTGLNSTTTNATTTSFFATTASSTNFSATLGNLGSLNVLANGLVGIGTTSPIATLAVNGTFKSQNFNTLYNNSVVVTTNVDTTANAGNESSIFGYKAGTSNSGQFLSAFGAWAGYQNTSSDTLTAIGYSSGYQSSGNQNTFIGGYAGDSASSLGNRNIAIGFSAGQSSQGANSIGIGYSALSQNTASNVIALGYQAGENNTTANQFIIKQNNINTTPLIQGDFLTGFVGIGTTTPGSILSVAGVGNFASTGSTLYSTLTSPYFTATSSTASVFPYASTTALTSGNAWFTGNVGIGTTNPSAKLHVEDILAGGKVAYFKSNAASNPNTALILDASTNANPNFVFQENEVDKFTLGYNSNQSSIGRIPDTLELYSFVSSAPILQIHQSAGANSFVIDSSGFIGLGTTTPGSILSVAGVGNFASTGSTLYSTLTAPYFTATSSTASVFPYASTTAISVSGLSYLNGGFLSLASSTLQNFTGLNSTTTNATSTNIYASGKIVTNTTLSSTFGNNLILQGGGSLTGSILFKDGDGNTRGSLGLAAGQFDSVTGYSVSGTSEGLTTTGLDLYGSHTISWRDVSYGSFDIGLARSAGGILKVTNGSSDFGNLIAGKLGVGTTSPWAALSIEGISSLGNNAIAGYFTATSSTASVFPYASSTAITVSGLSYLDGGFLSLASSTLQNFTGLNATTTNATTTNLYISNVLTVAGLSSFGGINASYASTTAISSGNAWFTGNVGIGTTSPWRTLSVNGSSDLGTNALAGYFTATTTTASVFPYASTTAISSGNAWFTGNVGIGTTTPSYSLDVATTTRTNNLIVNSLTLSGSYGSTIQAVVGSSTGYTNFSGGIGTGGADSIGGPYNNALRITNTGNLVNIGSIQSGEINSTYSTGFKAQVTYTVGTSPEGVSTGDLNGDGKADIVAANYNSAIGTTVSVLLNNGDGTFPATGTTYTVGTGPVGVSIGDLNGDGKSDIVTANYAGGAGTTVSVLINNGNGTFATKVNYTVGNGPQSVSIGDLNGDGKADIIAANGSPAVSILLNNGDGTFPTTGTTYIVGSSPSSVSVGDLNGDGKADIVTANSGSTNVSVLLNNGNGTFASHITYTVGNGPSSVSIGDVNGDGKADIVTANISSANVSVLLNNGNGTFPASVNYTVGTGPVGVSIGDLNGDGKVDIVAVNGASGAGTTASVLLNNGNGTFATQVTYTVGTGPRGVSIGDLNGDGKSDIVATNGAAGVGTTVSVLINATSTLLFANAKTGNVGIGTSSPYSRLTVWASTSTPGNILQVVTTASSTALLVTNGGLVGLGTTTPAWQFQVASSTPFLTLSNTSAAANFKHWTMSSQGGNFYLATSSDAYATSTIAALTVNSNGWLGIGTTSPSSALSVNGGIFTTASSTFMNGVNLTTGCFSVNGTCLSSGSSLPTGTAGQTLSYVGSTLTATSSLFIGTNSFIGIGTTTPQYSLDVATTTRTNNLIVNSLTLSGSYGSIIQAVVGSSTGYTNFSGGIGTGGADSIGGPYNNALRITNTGNLVNIGSVQSGEINSTYSTGFQARVTYGVGTNPIGTSVGDMNGDGKVDIVAANYTDSNVSVLLNNGNGTFPATSPVYTVGTNPFGVSIGDLNGDGKADIVTANSGSTNISVLINNGNGTFATKVNYTVGSVPYGVSIGDLNGDGKADIAVVNGGDTTVSILLNNGNGTFANQATYSVVSGSQSISIADLNGDGKADIVTTNTGGTTVAVILNNGNGTFSAPVTYTVGTSPYGVSIGDLNGDGKADIVAANNSTSNVSVLINNGNGTFATKVNYTVGTAPYGVSIGDLNGDGKADIVASDGGGTTVSILLNNGDGTFASRVNYDIGSAPRFVSIGDLNGDGKADIISGNLSNATVSVLINATSTLLFANAKTGNVGIGTSTPYARLTVWASTSTPGNILQVVTTASSTALVVSNAGFVGIGTTTPTAKLTVQADSGSGDILNIASSTGSSLLYMNYKGQLAVGTQSVGNSLFTLSQTSNGTSTVYTKTTSGDFSVAGSVASTTIATTSNQISLNLASTSAIQNIGNGTVTTGPTTLNNIGAGSFSIIRPDGKFLVVTGNNSTATNIYDSVTNTFASGPVTSGAVSSGGFAIQRPDGTFLIVHGGTTGTSIYDPVGNTIVAGPATSAATGGGARAIKKPDGKYLITHGGATNTASVYDPVNNTMIAATSAGIPTMSHGSHSILRSNGTYFVVVGGGSTATYIYDPNLDTFTNASNAGLSTAGNSGANSIQLPDGKFIIIDGGGGVNGDKTTIYNTAYNITSTGPTLSATANFGSFSIQRPDGKFLIAHAGSTNSSSIYNPVTNTMSSGPTFSATVGSGGHAIHLSDGRYLVFHGQGAATTSIYDPSWGVTGYYETEPMNLPRLNMSSIIKWNQNSEGLIQIAIKTATTNAGLASATYSTTTNGAYVYPVKGAAWAQVRVWLTRSIPSIAQPYTINYQNNVWLGESDAKYQRNFAIPTIYDLTIDSSAVIRKDNADFGLGFATSTDNSNATSTTPLISNLLTGDNGLSLPYGFNSATTTATSTTFNGYFASSSKVIGTSANTVKDGANTLQLPNGRFLIIQGNGTTNTSLYDPNASSTAGLFSPGPATSGNVNGGSSSFQRPDGKFVVIHGGGSATSIYDPVANTFSAGPTVVGTAANSVGQGANVIKRPDGRFLVILGNSTSDTSVYDPVANTFIPGPAVRTTLGSGSDIVSNGSFSIQRPDGKFLFVTGNNKSYSSIYDPVANTFIPGPSLSGLTAGSGTYAIQRSDGQFLIISGGDGTGTSVYNPVTDTSATGPTLPGTSTNGGHAIQRPDGKFLLILTNNTTTNTAIYDPVANTFATGPTMPDITASSNGSHSIQRPDGKYLTFVGNTSSTTIMDAGWVTQGSYQSELIYSPNLDSTSALVWTGNNDAFKPGAVSFRVRTAPDELSLSTATWRSLPTSGSLINPTSGDQWMQVRIDMQRSIPTMPGAQKNVWLGGDNGVVVYNRLPLLPAAGIPSTNQAQVFSKPTITSFKVTNSLNSDLATFTSDGQTLFRFSASGDAYTNGGSWTSGGADVAEEFPTDDFTLEPGDVVSIASNDSTGLISKTTTPYDEHMVGIVSTAPGVRLGMQISGGQAGTRPIALNGRVPVKVSLENGPITKGDYLTSSSIAGVAMKATDPGRTVAIALESYTDESTTPIILAFVNPIEHPGTGGFFSTMGKKLVLWTSAITDALLSRGVFITKDNHVSVGTTTDFAEITLQSTTATSTALVLVGAPGQSVQIFGIQDASNNSLLTVDAGGNVGIGTTTLDGKLTVGGDVSLNLIRSKGTGVNTFSGSLSILGTTTSMFASNLFVGGNFSVSSSTINDLISNNIQSSSFTINSASSSISDISYTNATDTPYYMNAIRSIKPAMYRYLGESLTKPLHFGIIAEDAPLDILSVNREGIDLYKFSTLLTIGVQDLDRRLTMLESRLASSTLVDSAALTLQVNTAVDTAVHEAVASSTVIESIVTLASFKTRLTETIADILRGTTDWVVNQIHGTLAYFTTLQSENFTSNTITASSITATSTLTVGSSTAPTGITLFDGATGQPYCLKVMNGVMTPTQGQCQAQTLIQQQTSQTTPAPASTPMIVTSPTPSTAPTSQTTPVVTSPTTSTSTPEVITSTTTPEVVTTPPPATSPTPEASPVPEVTPAPTTPDTTSVPAPVVEAPAPAPVTEPVVEASAPATQADAPVATP